MQERTVLFVRLALVAMFVGGVVSDGVQPLGAQQPSTPSRNAVTTGEFVVEPPTLINLGFEWFIQGDENRNASVEVSFRKQGTTAWRPALPLLRLKGERVYTNTQFDVVAPNMFAGSILDLESDTLYEARFTISDADGVSGEREKTVSVRTRAEPKPYEGGRVFHVYPIGFKGTKVEPSFEGLMCAYNLSCSGSDRATAGRPRVRAGDTLLVHAGLYRNNRFQYNGGPPVTSRTVPLEGTYYLTADGTPEMPIAIKAAGDGEVIVDGEGNFALFNVMAADYTYFEGITFRNTEVAIWAGEQFIAGSKGLSVKRCRFENVGAGIFTNYSGSSNFYVADNRFYGRNDPKHLIGWSDATLWSRFNGIDGQVYPPVMASYTAVRLYGQGHVVAFNYVTDFHDSIDVETYGNPDGSYPSAPGVVDGPKYPTREYWDRRPVAIDIYNNYLTNSHDNPIETDGSLHNVRVMRNMLINHASHAMCNQPVLGGPIYWIRNVAYNLPGGSTRLAEGAAGVVFYNNTILSETTGTTQNSHWRNNLILGQNGLSVFSPTKLTLFGIRTYTNYTSSDYNGFGPAPDTALPFFWESPPFGVVADIPSPDHQPVLETREYATLGEYSKATGQDQHSFAVDYDVFANVPRLDARKADTLQRIYDAASLDFRLKPGSAPVDRGVVLPTVTDGFTGKAPDLGALEVGVAAPHYGPR